MVPIPNVKACDFLGLVEFFSETLHDNLLVLRAKQLGRSMKKPTIKHQPKTIENLCQVLLSGVSLEDLFLLSYENATIDNNEFSVLHEKIMPKNPDFSYEEHDRISLEEMNDAEFSARYNQKRPSRYKILS